MLKWSSQNGLAKSKLVRSSGIWFIIVPIAAKILEGFDGKIPITLNGKVYELLLGLPFSWQTLFFAALFFMIAKIIYQVRCKEIVKNYNSYSQFELEGNSRLQINQHLKNVIWNNKLGRIDDDYKAVADTYIISYTNKNKNEINVDIDYLVVLDDLTKASGRDSNAFYFVYNISDKYGQIWIKMSSFFYILGFISLIAIAISNIVFVIRSITP